MAETPQPPHSAEGETLTELKRGILDFEKKSYKYSGAKEDAIHERFGLTTTQYYQILNGLIDQPAARRYAPYVVERLQQQRTARTAGAGGTRSTRTPSTRIQPTRTPSTRMNG